MVLLGGACTVAVLLVATARRATDVARCELLLGLASRVNLFLVIPAAVVSIALGEGLKAKEDATGDWLDVGSGLAYVVVLVGALVLQAFLRRGLAATTVGLPPSASTLRGAASIAP